MARKDSGLTKVKDYRYNWPTGEPSAPKRRSASVMLNPETGMFTITYPEELVKVLAGDPAAHGREMNEAIRVFDRKVEKYGNTIRTQKSKPMLVIHFAYNRPRRKDGSDRANLWGVRQLGEKGPDVGLALSYERLWQIDNALYSLAVDEDTGDIYGAPQHRYTLPLKHKKVMAWTDEREAFLENMQDSLQALAERVNEFFASDWADNIDRAIASGVSGFALPAPRAD